MNSILRHSQRTVPDHHLGSSYQNSKSKLHVRSLSTKYHENKKTGFLLSRRQPQNLQSGRPKRASLQKTCRDSTIAPGEFNSEHSNSGIIIFTDHKKTKKLPRNRHPSAQMNTSESQTKGHEIHKDFLVHISQDLKIVRSLPEPDLSLIRQKVIKLPHRKSLQCKKTLVFDLDETLIHHCASPTDKPDCLVTLTLPNNGRTQVGIKIRPFAKECLKFVNKYFEVIVFTASHKFYADPILDYLDPRRQLIHYRLYREDCIFIEGVYVKDLRILGNRQLKDIAIIDNSVCSFAYQLSNGIPIISWYDNKADVELKKLRSFLKSLVNEEDIRVPIERTYKLQEFMMNSEI